MSQDNYDNQEQLFSLLVAREKSFQFQQWCERNQVDSQVMLEKIIDACLTNEEIITSFLLTENNQLSFDEKIKFYLDKSLEPVISRIEQLEAQINRASATISSPEKLAQIEVEVKPEQKDIETKNITYLPRNEVWRRLKQTDYIKYAGYDSFLKARGDEFIQYGIFFDSNKKRFYLVND